MIDVNRTSERFPTNICPKQIYVRPLIPERMLCARELTSIQERPRDKSIPHVLSVSRTSDKEMQKVRVNRALRNHGAGPSSNPGNSFRPERSARLCGGSAARWPDSAPTLLRGPETRRPVGKGPEGEGPIAGQGPRQLQRQVGRTSYTTWFAYAV